MIFPGEDVSMYARDKLMSAAYDDTPLSKLADDKIKSFQFDASQVAGVFHHLITLPTYHTAALSTDNITKGSVKLSFKCDRTPKSGSISLWMQ